MHGEEENSGRSAGNPHRDAACWRALLQHIPHAAYVCDPDGRVVGFNDLAIRIWGRTPGACEQADRLFAGFHIADAEGQPVEYSASAVAKAHRSRADFCSAPVQLAPFPTGESGKFIVSAHPWQTAATGRLGTICILERVWEQTGILDAQRFLNSIVASSDDAIVSKDLDGRIQTWNSGAERLFGYAAHEAIGNSILLIIPPELHEEERGILNTLRRGERIAHFETWRVHKNGRRIPVSLSVSPIFDEAGKIIGAAKVARDISAQKAAAAELLELQQVQFGQVADLLRLQQMSLKFSETLDLESILQETLQTACALSETTFGLLSLYDLQQDQFSVGASLGCGDRLLAELQNQWQKTGTCGSFFRVRTRVVVEDVSTDPAFDGMREVLADSGICALHSTPLITRTGKLLGVLLLGFPECHRPSDREVRLLDICARQAVDYIENARLYRELQLSDQRKDEFLAILAHELRNPLAPLTNALEIMRLSDNLDPELNDLREIMNTQVQHLVRLVDDLLDVSRITCGKIELRKEPVDLRSVIGTAVETSRPHIDAAGHRFEIDLPAEPIPLEVDPVRIAQVVANLLNNASKYTPSPGRIRLSAGVEGSEAVIRVEDNGHGIPPELLPGLFEMFAQAEHLRTQSHAGLGLGLAVARGLVELHHGTLAASSDGPGCGACFTVRLPVVNASVCPSSTAVPADERPRIARRRIVVVDDTRTAAYILGKLLETLNQEVYVAYDARSALELVHSRRPHVVISDIAMPEMDGYDLARRLRASAAAEGIKLVALTGYGQEADRQRTREAGFDSHLVKPVGVGALEELLNSLPDTDPFD